MVWGQEERWREPPAGAEDEGAKEDDGARVRKKKKKMFVSQPSVFRQCILFSSPSMMYSCAEPDDSLAMLRGWRQEARRATPKHGRGYGYRGGHRWWFNWEMLEQDPTVTVRH